MSALRFLMLLSLAVWIGALVFFPVTAQTAFSTLPARHLAGFVVRDCLINLHLIGMTMGAIFLASSLSYNLVLRGRAATFSLAHVFVATMIVLTAISQFEIIPRMDLLRASAVDIGALAASNPIRAHFDSLHVWSTRIEFLVLALGLLALYFTSRQLASSRS